MFVDSYSRCLQKAVYNVGFAYWPNFCPQYLIRVCGIGVSPVFHVEHNEYLQYSLPLTLVSYWMLSDKREQFVALLWIVSFDLFCSPSIKNAGGTTAKLFLAVWPLSTLHFAVWSAPFYNHTLLIIIAQILLDFYCFTWNSPVFAQFLDKQCLHVQSSFFAEPLRNADLFSNFAGFTVNIAHKTPFFACFYAYITKNYAVLQNDHTM